VYILDAFYSVVMEAEEASGVRLCQNKLKHFGKNFAFIFFTAASVHQVHLCKDNQSSICGSFRSPLLESYRKISGQYTYCQCSSTPWI